VIKDLAAKYNKTPAQIVLRWGVQRGTTIIPKTSKKERLAENIDLFNFTLTHDEVKSIDSLNKDKRFNDPGHYAEGAFKQFYPIWE
jgi:D-xylose reductase